MLQYSLRDDRIWAATWRSVFVALLVDNATVAGLERMLKAERTFRDELLGKKFTVITIVPVRDSDG